MEFYPPSITIVTVVLDDLDGLISTGKSLFEQSSFDFEWIVVDGSSGEEHSTYINHLDVGFRSYYFKLSPQGIYNAMNFAVNQSHSDWLWFLNAGDVLLGPHAIKEVESLIEKSKNVSVISTPVVYLTPTGFIFSIAKNSLETIDNYMIAAFNHQGAIINKSEMRIAGGFNENYHYAADGELLDRMVKNNLPLFSNKILVGFEMGGISSVNYKKTLNEIDLYRPISKTQSKNLLSLRFSNYIRVLLTKLSKNNYMKHNFILVTYLEYRQNKVIKDSLGSFNFIEHFRNHGDDSNAEYGCCFKG